MSLGSRSPALVHGAIAGVVCATSALAACEPAFAPGEPIAETVAARVRAARPQPIAVASRGTVELAPDVGSPVAVVDVAVTVDRGERDARDERWTLDADSATLAVGGGLPVHAIAASSDVATLPLAGISPGERRTVELYFPAPATAGDSANLELALRVGAPSGAFELRRTIGPATEPIAAAGRAWWFDPSYAWDHYAHRDGIIVPAPPARASLAVSAVSAIDWSALPALDDHACDEW
jgi:hypothetical protein